MAGDTHDWCVVCLGLHHVQAALSGLSTCSHCDGPGLKVLPFQISLGSTNLHEMYGCSSVPVAAPGRLCAKLPGRLAGISAITDSSMLSPWPRAKSSKQPGLTHESPKECFDPLPTNNLFGDRSGFSRYEGTTVSPTFSVIKVMPSPLQSRSYSDGEFVPQTFGSSGGSIPCNPSRLTQHAPISMVDKKPKYLSRCHQHRTISVTRGCVLTLKTWTSSKFLRKGVWLGTCFRRETVTTDASLTSWRAVCQGRPAHGTWTEAHRGWHINRLELLAVFLKTNIFNFSEWQSCVSQDGQHNELCHIWITKEDYALAPYAGRRGMSCGGFCRSERFTSRSTWTSERTCSWDQVWRKGNGGCTLKRWAAYGKCLEKRKWTYSHWARLRIACYGSS